MMPNNEQCESARTIDWQGVPPMEFRPDGMLWIRHFAARTFVVIDRNGVIVESESSFVHAESLLP